MRPFGSPLVLAVIGLSLLARDARGQTTPCGYYTFADAGTGICCGAYQCVSNNQGGSGSGSGSGTGGGGGYFYPDGGAPDQFGLVNGNFTVDSAGDVTTSGIVLSGGGYGCSTALSGLCYLESDPTGTVSVTTINTFDAGDYIALNVALDNTQGLFFVNDTTAAAALVSASGQEEASVSITSPYNAPPGWCTIGAYGSANTDTNYLHSQLCERADGQLGVNGESFVLGGEEDGGGGIASYPDGGVAPFTVSGLTVDGNSGVVATIDAAGDYVGKGGANWEPGGAWNVQLINLDGFTPAITTDAGSFWITTDPTFGTPAYLAMTGGQAAGQNSIEIGAGIPGLTCSDSGGSISTCSSNGPIRLDGGCQLGITAAGIVNACFRETGQMFIQPHVYPTDAVQAAEISCPYGTGTLNADGGGGFVCLAPVGISLASTQVAFGGPDAGIDGTYAFQFFPVTGDLVMSESPDDGIDRIQANGTVQVSDATKPHQAVAYDQVNCALVTQSDGGGFAVGDVPSGGPDAGIVCVTLGGSSTVDAGTPYLTLDCDVTKCANLAGAPLCQMAGVCSCRPTRRLMAVLSAQTGARHTRRVGLRSRQPITLPTEADPISRAGSDCRSQVHTGRYLAPHSQLPCWVLVFRRCARDARLLRHSQSCTM